MIGRIRWESGHKAWGKALHALTCMQYAVPPRGVAYAVHGMNGMAESGSLIFASIMETALGSGCGAGPAAPNRHRFRSDSDASRT